jgi:SAM-dependent methyltransferase
LVGGERVASRGRIVVTFLAKDPDLWDAVFSESATRARFVRRLARRIGPKVLDVGCATGSLCALLRRQGFDPVGIDKNRRVVGAARRKDPNGTYVVGDMRAFKLHRKSTSTAYVSFESPEGLTVAELAVYEGLRANRWGERVRLEQERIAWPAALEAIFNALGNHQ